jgi:hypothetical protein
MSYKPDVIVVPYREEERFSARRALRFVENGEPYLDPPRWVFADRDAAEAQAQAFNSHRYVARCVRYWKAHGVWPSPDVEPRPSRSSK